jgi:hypothetical protein
LDLALIFNAGWRLQHLANLGAGARKKQCDHEDTAGALAARNDKIFTLCLIYRPMVRYPIFYSVYVTRNDQVTILCRWYNPTHIKPQGAACMKFIRLGVFIFFIAIAVSACQKTSNVLFSDNFSDKSKKWDSVTQDTFITDYYSDTYRILVDTTTLDAWANPDKLSFTDVQVEVDATKNGGPDYNDFGIICRYKDTNSYYYGTISSDGFFAIMKKTAEGAKPIGQGGEQFSDKIVLGKATNHIRFDCIGSSLTLYANGTQLDQQTDADYTAGNIGLIAGTYTDPGTDILFDNVVVNKP